MSKRCSKCGETKSIDDFHRNITTSDGHDYFCKVCRKISQQGRWRKRWIQATNERYPVKLKARTTVQKLIRKGELTRLECFLCGKDKTHAHHLDYDYPEKVVWLCAACHSNVHREMKYGA